MATGRTFQSAQVFGYDNPGVDNSGKIHINLCETDILSGSVQVVGDEGANNLHSHKGKDGMWLVLEGRARFYTADDEVLGEFDQYEGVMVPSEFPYWFESIGEKKLEILHVVATDPTANSTDRVNFEDRKRGGGNNEYFDGVVEEVTDPRAR